MEIVWSSLAIEHLICVLNYVEEQFGALTAQKTHQKIVSKINQLIKYPQIGIPDFNFYSFVGEVEVRYLTLSPNLIYYLIDGSEVVVVAILHSQQSPETIRKVVTGFLKDYK